MNWLDITLLCLAGIGFVKGLFDGIIKQVVSLIALVIAIFFCGKAAAWLKGYILALGGRGDTVERYQPFVWWFFRVAGRFGLYQFAVERAGVRGSRIGLDSSPIEDRISFLL